MQKLAPLDRQARVVQKAAALGMAIPGNPRTRTTQTTVSRVPASPSCPPSYRCAQACALPPPCLLRREVAQSALRLPSTTRSAILPLRIFMLLVKTRDLKFSHCLRAAGTRSSPHKGEAGGRPAAGRRGRGTAPQAAASLPPKRFVCARMCHIFFLKPHLLRTNLACWLQLCL